MLFCDSVFAIVCVYLHLQVLYAGQRATTTPYPAFTQPADNIEWVELTPAFVGKPAVPYVNSTTLSQYMLRTYNDHQRSVRYGAYAFGDSVALNATIDWPAITGAIDAGQCLSKLMYHTTASVRLPEPQFTLGAMRTAHLIMFMQDAFAHYH
jgi:hypothetical protein